jgi:hypothetical protein
MRPARTQWLSAGLLALAVGCNHSQKRSDGCDTCCASPSCATPGVSMVKMPADPKASPTPATPTPTTPLPAAPTPATPMMNSKPAVVPPPGRVAPVSPSDGGLRTTDVPRVLPPVIHGAPAPMTMPVPAPVAVPVPPLVGNEESTAPQENRPLVLPKIGEPASPVRGTGPIGNPSQYHSPDYSILVGELSYNTRLGTWRLRYAAADEEDRYGGSVTLDAVGRQMQDYQHGQRVRVEGALVDPESRGVSPAYRVRELRPHQD